MTKRPDHQFSKDGSSTLFSNQFEQFYHNPNGAVSESKYVFFEASGLAELIKDNPESISVFEVGFGTGLNFLLLLDTYLQYDCAFPFHFYSVEAFPVSEETSAEFNYHQFLHNSNLEEVLQNIFRQLKAGKNTFFPIPGKNIQLHLFYNRFDEIQEIDHQIDFVFHDAFSPEVNEELWSVEVFETLASFCKSDAMLSTYCASSKARAALAKAGWFLGKAPGALGKREMTLASLSDTRLEKRKRVNEKRLIERWDAGEFK